MVDDDTPCGDIACYCSVAVMSRVLLHQCFLLQLSDTSEQLDLSARATHYCHSEGFLVTSVLLLTFIETNAEVLCSSMHKSITPSVRLL